VTRNLVITANFIYSQALLFVNCGDLVVMNAQLLLDLVDAALAADYTAVRRCAGALAAALEADGEHVAAQAMKARMRKSGVPLRASGYMETLPVDNKSRLPLLEEQPAASQPIFLAARENAVFENFLEDVSNVDRLAAKGLASRLCMMVSGPPGTGKSLLAAHVAQRLGRPFYVVRLDSAISSLLGDTAKNVRAIFDFIPMREAVLFLDEMDAIAKVRDDRHELGEVKRVVNTVLQGLDALGPEVVVVAATNHPHLLDPAIWRRFPYKIEFGLPGEDVRIALWRYFLYADKTNSDTIVRLFASISDGLSGADIETISLTARRNALIDGGEVDPAAVTWAIQQIKKGKPGLPPREPIGRDERRELIEALSPSLNAAEIGRLLGVTRQAVRYHLKQADSDGH
jgi:KaiC/GvpD/RAD55 family RecA-like ATPase